MSVKDFAKVLIYRFAEKGLEILLVKDEDVQHEQYRIPQSESGVESKFNNTIDLDLSIDKIKSEIKNAFAVESEEEELPSLRKMLYKDAKYVKAKFQEHIPEIEDASFVTIKEAVKKTLPQEYELLRKLKDILVDRNSLRNI